MAAKERGLGLLANNNYTYDVMDRLTLTGIGFFDAQTQAPLFGGHATNLTIYSPNSQVLTNYDANGNPTATLYDTANRRLVTIDAKGNAVTNGYDPNGNVICVIELERSDLTTNTPTFNTTNVFDDLD